jgi:AI-2 transport protein TqsA
MPMGNEQRDRRGMSGFVRLMLLLAAFVIVVAGMKAAASVVVPMLLAVFIAILIAPWFVSLRRRGVPGPIALLVMVFVLVGVSVGAIGLITRSLGNFGENMPTYQEQITTQMSQLRAWLDARGIDILDPVLTNPLKLPSVVDIARMTSTALGQTFIVLIVAIFILLEATILPEKIRSLPGTSEEAWERLNRIVEDVRHYMGMKTLMSLLTGALVAAWLAILNIDYPILLGILAFALNYIPNVGSFIAAIPGVLLAFMTHGIGSAAICAVGYAAINVGVSNGIEPRFMGYRLGLSPLVIIISMIFWGWVLGPVGMLLSVPLTMTVRIAMESGEDTQSIGLLLGTGGRDLRHTPGRRKRARALKHNRRVRAEREDERSDAAQGRTGTESETAP